MFFFFSFLFVAILQLLVILIHPLVQLDTHALILLMRRMITLPALVIILDFFDIYWHYLVCFLCLFLLKFLVNAFLIEIVRIKPISFWFFFCSLKLLVNPTRARKDTRVVILVPLPTEITITVQVRYDFASAYVLGG